MSITKSEQTINPYHLAVPERETSMSSALRARTEISGIYNQAMAHVKLGYETSPYVSPERTIFLQAQSAINECAKDIEYERKLAMDSVLFNYERNKHRRFGQRAKDFIEIGLGITPSPSSHDRVPQDLTERELIEQERVVSATLFKVEANGTEQTFYNLNRNEWIWYQTNPAWDRPITTRYEIQSDRILKIQDIVTASGESRSGYPILAGEELSNLVAMTQEYRDRVIEYVYSSTEPSKSDLDLAA